MQNESPRGTKALIYGRMSRADDLYAADCLCLDRSMDSRSQTPGLPTLIYGRQARIDDAPADETGLSPADVSGR